MMGIGAERRADSVRADEGSEPAEDLAELARAGPRRREQIRLERGQRHGLGLHRDGDDRRREPERASSAMKSRPSVRPSRTARPR